MTSPSSHQPIKWLDGEEYGQSAVFRGPSRATDAAEWIAAFTAGQPNRPVLWVCDEVAQPDNPATRARGISDRPQIHALIEEGCLVLREEVCQTQEGLFFWALLSTTADCLPEIVERLRDDRSSALLWKGPPQNCADSIAQLGPLRAAGKARSIDDAQQLKLMLRLGLSPIRVWSPPGETDLWVEKYP